MILINFNIRQSFNKSVLFCNFFNLLFNVFFLLFKDSSNVLNLFCKGFDLNKKRVTRAAFSAKIRATEIIILEIISISSPKIKPNIGTIVQAATICKIQKTIHLEEFSRLKTVPKKGKMKVVRMTKGDKRIKRNIINIM